jgi:AcrR family transcriptional regulator
VEDITDAADLGKGAFYNYFESKDALFAALLAEAVDLLDLRYLSGLPEAAYPERVRELCRRHESFFQAHPVYLLLIHQARGVLLRGADSQPGLATTFRRYLSRVAGHLENGAHAPSAEAVDQAATLVGAITGYHSFRIAAGLAPTEGAVERLLAHGLKAPGPA